jgi:outer membrane protein assembly factor BamB
MMPFGRRERRSAGRRLRHRTAVGACLTLLLTFVALVGVGGQTVVASPAPVSPSGSDWPSFLDGPSHGSYNAADTSIKPARISDLNPVWRWILPASTVIGSNALMASPTVVDGVIYIGSKDGEFYAFSETTHKILWSDFFGTACLYQGFTSTATVTPDPTTGNLTVYVDAPDGYLYALDAATGATVWKGFVDDPDPTPGACDYYSWGSPLVANGKVYIGISSDSRGFITGAGLVAFNQSTGATVATWNSLPAGEYGGSIWSSAALASNGTIIATTANGKVHNGSQPRYDQSIVDLNPDTLALESAWQVPKSQQVVDGDFGASPTMFTATLDGVSTPMVGECNKNGIYYAFQQDDIGAGPVWRHRVTVRYPGSSLECDSAAIWNGTDLIEGGGAPSSKSEPADSGSIVALNPNTGTPVWDTQLNGTIVGSPTENGGGVVAAQTWQTDNHAPGVYLLNAATGALIGQIITPEDHLFGQAVFADNSLLVGAGPAVGLTAYQITTPGPPISLVNPSTIPAGATTKVTLTGSGFSGTPTVFISGFHVYTKSVKVVSPTELTFSARATNAAAAGTDNVSVIEPGKPPVDDSCTSCITIG